MFSLEAIVVYEIITLVALPFGTTYKVRMIKYTLAGWFAVWFAIAFYSAYATATTGVATWLPAQAIAISGLNAIMAVVVHGIARNWPQRSKTK